MSDGTYYFFEITEYTDPATRQNLYDVEDCGTGGYGTCTTVATSSAYSFPWSVNAAETNFGGTPCSLQIMGASSAQLHIGASANPMEFQNGEGASWTTESLNDSGPVCNDYKGLYSDTVLGTYDNRN